LRTFYAVCGIMRRDMHWDYIVVLVVLGVLVPWRSRARIQALLAPDSTLSTNRIRVYLSTIAFQWAVAAIVAWRWFRHGGSVQDLGIMLPNERRAMVTVTLLSLLLIFNQIVGLRRLADLPREKRGIVGRLAEKLVPRTFSEKCVASVLVVTVAICEELIYRGFVQGLFQTWLSAVWAGVVISAVFFAVAHLYQGRRGLITTFAVGLIFSGVRVWTGSLLPSAIIHFVVDFTAGAASARLVASAESQD
jgi:uncharacterized protein